MRVCPIELFALPCLGGDVHERSILKDRNKGQNVSHLLKYIPRITMKCTATFLNATSSWGCISTQEMLRQTMKNHTSD